MGIVTPRLAEIAALVGNPARAQMLGALLGGRMLAAGELAAIAGLTPQTTSGHLAQMSEAGLVVSTRQGRFIYYRIASPLVGQMLEYMAAVAERTRVFSFPDAPRSRPSFARPA